MKKQRNKIDRECDCRKNNGKRWLFCKKNDPLVELTVPGVESDILKSEASLLYEKTEQYRYAILSESIQRNELPEIRITDFPGGEDNAEVNIFRGLAH